MIKNVNFFVAFITIFISYELQVAASAQGKGFGKNLVKELEKLCQFSDVEKIVLTVLKGLFSSSSFLTHALLHFPQQILRRSLFIKPSGK